ncbi:MAG: hypothetical protein AB1556_09345 [Bacillota bacterium]
MYGKKVKNSLSGTAGQSVDYVFGTAVGLFVLTHAEVLGLWSRLKADEAAGEAGVLAGGAQELAALAEQVNAAVEETASAHEELSRLAQNIPSRFRPPKWSLRRPSVCWCIRHKHHNQSQFFLSLPLYLKSFLYRAGRH